MLNTIRATAARVAELAEHVRLDPDRLAAFAADFPVAMIDDDSGDPGRQAFDDAEATASFVVALDAINFGSGYFPYIRKRPGHSGYHTVAASLRDYVSATGALTSERLARVTTTDCSQIFGQELDGGLQEELMAHFATALADLGALVATDFAGSFVSLIESADHSAETFAQTLDRLPYFHDVHPYRGFDVPLYKRAQITPYDVAVAFDHVGLGRFDDLDRLTMFADNLVPHVLRVEGVLAFDDALLARIEAVEDIPSGSPEEVEIRAVGLHAVELLVEALQDRGHHVNSGQVDGALWTLGGNAKYKAIPRHRTRCVFY